MAFEIANSISLVDPGAIERGIDAGSFTCQSAPAFSFSSVTWDYKTYTWHTNRDTFDKLVFDDLKNNATLFAMLAYLASEDEHRTPRANPEAGQPNSACAPPARNWAQRKP